MPYQLRQCGTNLNPSRGVVVAQYATLEEFEADWPDEWIAGTRLKCCWVSGIDPTPVKRWSADSKGSARRKRLWRRLEKKHPLLATVLYNEQIIADKDYYTGKTDRRTT